MGNVTSHHWSDRRISLKTINDFVMPAVCKTAQLPLSMRLSWVHRSRSVVYSHLPSSASKSLRRS